MKAREDSSTTEYSVVGAIQKVKRFVKPSLQVPVPPMYFGQCQPLTATGVARALAG